MIHTVGGGPPPVFCQLGGHGASLKSLSPGDFQREALELFKYCMTNLPSGTHEELKTLLKYASCGKDGEIISLLKNPEDLSKIKAMLEKP